MSEFEELFKQVIHATIKKNTKLSLAIGTVKEVNGDTCTVDAYEDVRLNAIIDDLESFFTIYPKLNSKVIIGRIEDEDSAFVVRFSEIDKITIKIGDQQFEMKEGKFSIKTGNVSLKSILNESFSQLENAIILTPTGPGKFSAKDKLAFKELNNKTNQLLS